MDPATTAWLALLSGAGLIGLVFGLFAAATRYCNMGAIADWVNMGDTGRFRAWLLSIAVAAAGVAILEFSGWLSLDETRAGYRMAEFPILRYLLGGLTFGVGMVLAGGCTTRTLVRIGSGNLQAVLVYLLVGLTAAGLLYLPGVRIWTEQALHWPGWSFEGLGLPGQDLGTLASALPTTLPLAALRLGATALMVALLAWLIWRLSRGQAMRPRDQVGGLTIGLAVIAGWALTASPAGNALMTEATAAFTPPAGTGAQSLTFVAPAAELLRFGTSPSLALLTFGLVAMFGVILGSGLWFVYRGQWRWQEFGNRSEWIRQGVGAVLMGAGGVVAMGCSVGQGITGVSTLALGSLTALAGMMLGSFLALKVLFYRVVYPDAGLSTVFLALATDLKLRPASQHPLAGDITPERRPRSCQD